MRLPSLWRGDSTLQRAFGDDFQKFFDDFFSRRGLALPAEGPLASFSPDVDVIDRNGDYVVKAELPGLSIGDIEVSMVGDALQIKGEKKEEKKEEKEGYYSCECSYGSFLRTIPLPAAIQADKIAAKLEKGVLEVVCPKSEVVKPKKIEVKGEAKEAAPKPAEAPRAREERPTAKR